MPQFRPYWWMNLISWILLIFTFLIWLNQSIYLPNILKLLLCRKFILFI